MTDSVLTHLGLIAKCVWLWDNNWDDWTDTIWLYDLGICHGSFCSLFLTKSGTFTFQWLFLGCIEANPSDRRLSFTCFSWSTWVSRWDSRFYNLTKRMKLRTLKSWCIWASTRPLVRRFVRWAWQKLHFDTECQKELWENNTTWRRDWRLLAKILHISARNEAKAKKCLQNYDTTSIDIGQEC